MKLVLQIISCLLLCSANNAQSIYGAGYAGGTYNNGVLFQYSLSTSGFSKKMDFDSTVTGSNPFCSIMQASNGNLYGVTTSGGANNKGVLYEYNPSSFTYVKKMDFDSIPSGA